MRPSREICIKNASTCLNVFTSKSKNSLGYILLILDSLYLAISTFQNISKHNKRIIQTQEKKMKY